MRRRKYCAGIGCNNLREKKSPSGDYCIECYERMKYRYSTWQEGLRGVRALVNGTNNKELALRGFFAYVMPEITDERANELAKELAKNSA